jgi:hypothetical protein
MLGIQSLKENRLRSVVNNCRYVGFAKIEPSATSIQFMKLWISALHSFHDFRGPLVCDAVYGRIQSVEPCEPKCIRSVKRNSEDRSFVSLEDAREAVCRLRELAHFLNA